MKKIFRGDCVSNPFISTARLSSVIDGAKEISKETFLKNVDVQEMTMYGLPLRTFMRKYPNDFAYYSYKGKIYFFTQSMIEYFFW